MQGTFWFLCNFWESVVRQCFSSILVTNIGHTLFVSKYFSYQKIDHNLLLTKEFVTYWKSLISRFCLFKYHLANNLKKRQHMPNRPCAISNCIPKNSLLCSNEMFKTFFKITIIQSGLSNLWNFIHMLNDLQLYLANVIMKICIHWLLIIYRTCVIDCLCEWSAKIKFNSISSCIQVTLLLLPEERQVWKNCLRKFKNFINILCTPFLYKRALRSSSIVTFWLW